MASREVPQFFQTSDPVGFVGDEPIILRESFVGEREELFGLSGVVPQEMAFGEFLVDVTVLAAGAFVFVQERLLNRKRFVDAAERAQGPRDAPAGDQDRLLRRTAFK